MIVAKLWRRLKYWKFFVRSFAVHGVVALHRFGLLSEDRVVSARMWAVRAVIPVTMTLVRKRTNSPAS